MKKGYFGRFGGRFIPEILLPAMVQLENAYAEIKEDEEFRKEFLDLLHNYSGRPTPLTFAKNLTEYFGRAKIYIKREDLNHSGAHKITNVLGQGLLMKKLGKTRVIAETGAGQHGVATAIMAAKFGYKATIYMGAEDVKRQYSNVFWMKQLGAEVVAVESGTATLKDAINEALRDWASSFDETHYCLGTACGPYPFPEMVTFFQQVISEEMRAQILEKEGRLPSRVYACLGGGSNAMGAFYHFLPDEGVKLIAVEGGGKGKESGEHASRIAYDGGILGVSQGYKTLFIQDDDGQMLDTWSISAGLDYTGVSPIIAHFAETGRVDVEAAMDDDVISAFRLVVSKEGLMPALESSHAFAGMIADIESTTKDDVVIVNMSGRGDKDIFNIAEALDDPDWKEYVSTRGASYGVK
jgi:tryptophan synthase beta chain